MLKRFFPRTLFSSPSSIAHFSTSSPSHLSGPYSHTHPDSGNVRVSVWWNHDSCPVPPGVNAFRVGQAIKTAVESIGIGGPIQITAFGDMLQLSRTNHWALSSTAIETRHVPEGFSVDEELQTCLKNWVSNNPAPAHLFFITDGGSASLLHQLRMKNYNTLLATKESAPAVLSNAAAATWRWDALVRGDINGDDSQYVAPEVLSRDSFWRDMLTYLQTDVGSFILNESSTRENLGYYLQKYGPSDVRSFTKRDALLMVHMLILEKKLVLEYAPDLKPFKLASSANSEDFSDSDSDSDSDDDFSDSEEENAPRQ